MKKTMNNNESDFSAFEFSDISEGEYGSLTFENKDIPMPAVIAVALISLGMLLLIAALLAGYFYTTAILAIILAATGGLTLAFGLIILGVFSHRSKRRNLPRTLTADTRSKWWQGPGGDPFFPFDDTDLVVVETGIRPPRGVLYYWLYVDSPRGRVQLCRTTNLEAMQDIANRLKAMGMKTARVESSSHPSNRPVF